MTEYYNGNLENAMDKPEVCWYRSYGADSDSTHDDSSQWRVLNARLTFVIIFEVLTRLHARSNNINDKYFTPGPKNSNSVYM